MELQDGYYVAMVEDWVAPTIIYVTNDGHIVLRIGYEKNVSESIWEILCGPFSISEAIKKLS